MLNQKIVKCRIMRLRESGIIDQLTDRYVKHTDKCNIHNMESQSSAGNPLALYAMISAFIVLGIGVGLSLLVFVCEIVFHSMTSGSWINKCCAFVSRLLLRFKKAPAVFFALLKIAIIPPLASFVSTFWLRLKIKFRNIYN